MTLFYLLDIIGTMAFATSGALTAMSKKLDLFGVLIVAVVTAVGGGTLRDVMIGSTPVCWRGDLNYVYAITIAFVLAVVFRGRFDKYRTSLLLFDTIGFGVFTLIGLAKGLAIGLHPVICVALGMITACFGGVIRDILCNDIPVIFQREIYATICLLGGAVFFALRYFNLPTDVLYLVTSLVMIAVRLLAIRYKWSLPSLPG